MQITAYPPFRRVIGSDVLEVDLPDGTPLRDLLRWLGERYPPFAPLANAPSDEFLWQHLIVHVNDEIAGLNTPLSTDDHLELLPTIAGGAEAGRRASGRARRSAGPPSASHPRR